MDQMEKNDRKTNSLRYSMLTGSAWMVAMRWSIRFIGIISTAILARLLAPEDFGLVAMCMLFIGLLDVMTGFGVDMALIQRRELSREHYDTAWTIRLLQCLFVAGCVFMLAPFAANYFGEPRVTKLLYILTSTIIIAGLENIGTVAFRKDLEFSKEFKYQVITKFAAFIMTIVAAFIFRNYWALVFGMIGGRIYNIVLSYRLHPYRPQICFKKFGDIWGFSQWMLLRNIGMYIRRRTDTILVGGYFSTSTMGLYSVSQEISETPTTELVWPMARALFPGYAKISHDIKWLGKVYLKTLNGVAIIIFSTGVGVALLAEPIVHVALGEQWVGAIPLIPWLALYGVLLTLSANVQNVLMAIGRMKRLVFVVWLQLIVALPVLVFAASTGDILYLIQAQVLVTFLTLPAFFVSITSLSIVTGKDIVEAIWRPALASAVMSAVLMFFDYFWLDNYIMQLIVKVIIGFVVFIISNLIFWYLSGQPDSGEAVFVEIIKNRLKKH